MHKSTGWKKETSRRHKNCDDVFLISSTEGAGDKAQVFLTIKFKRSGFSRSRNGRLGSEISFREVDFAFSGFPLHFSLIVFLYVNRAGFEPATLRYELAHQAATQ